MLIDPSYLITFVAGALTGAASQYLGDKYSDRRREKEALSKARKEFRRLQNLMPTLLQEMRDDLETDQENVVREFFVMPSKGSSIVSNKKRFRYDEPEHESLREKLDLLAHGGFITDMRNGRTPMYRMEETFVQLLRSEISPSKQRA